MSIMSANSNGVRGFLRKMILRSDPLTRSGFVDISESPSPAKGRGRIDDVRSAPRYFVFSARSSSAIVSGDWLSASFTIVPHGVAVSGLDRQPHLVGPGDEFLVLHRR